MKKMSQKELEFQQYLRDLQSKKDAELFNPSVTASAKRRDMDKLISHAANTPLIGSDDLVRKARELGYDPRDLITKALGSVQLDKSSGNISQDLEDLANQVDESQASNVPGERYIVDPNKKNYGQRTKQVVEELGDGAGVYIGRKAKDQRFSPEFMAILDAKNEMDKLDSLGIRSHELGHGEDYLIKPGYRSQGESFQQGHHAGKGIFEANELIREAKDLPKNPKELEEIAKQAKKLGGTVSPWRRLMSVLGHVGPIGAGIGAAAALQSGDVPAAVLHGASAVDPTGISDAALEVNRRLKMMPEEAKRQYQEDMLSALPVGLKEEYQFMQDLENTPDTNPKSPNRFKKIREQIK